MFDLQATIRWVTGVIQAPTDTAQAYREADPPWLQTFLQLPLPLIVAASVVALVLAGATGTSVGLGAVGIGSFVFMLIFSIGWSFLLAVVIDQLAGVFDGEKNFQRAYAVVGLALVPVTIGNALGVLPFVGWLINIGGSIYGLYLTYQFVPIFLAVPEGKRVGHIVSVVVAAVVAGVVLSMLIGGLVVALSGGVSALSDEEEPVESEIVTESSGGFFGGLERQAEIAEKAGEDVYEPPSDGELTEDQVERFVGVLQKTTALRERLTNKFENMDDENASLSDILGGTRDAIRLGTAEMEVVKTGGGNWAEHQWVRNQLEVARVQQDINDTVKHNYKLFLKYAEDIERFE